MELTARRWPELGPALVCGVGHSQSRRGHHTLISAPDTWEKVEVDPTQPAALQTPPRAAQLPMSLGPQVASTQCSQLIRPQEAGQGPISKHSWVPPPAAQGGDYCGYFYSLDGVSERSK